jgi:hypothetical protein
MDSVTFKETPARSRAAALLHGYLWRGA